MRNCFVPNCDAQFKQKRMMFMPPKNEDIFKAWKDILPKKRNFKRTDRVCERHFSKSDISTTWDHLINGVLHQLERGKPKLNPTAVPLYNFPTEWGGWVDANSEEYQAILAATVSTNGKVKEKEKKPVKRKITQNVQVMLKVEKKSENQNETDEQEGKKSPPTAKKRKQIFDKMPTESIYEIEEPQSSQVQIEDDEQQEVEETESTTECTKTAILEIEQSIDESPNNPELDIEKFDQIYDDIYEVELPNTMWGIHRDPDRKFVIFSIFDVEQMRSSKVVYVDNKLITKCYIYNEKLETNKHGDMTIEMLNDLLLEMDEYRICANYMATKPELRTCELLVLDYDDLCNSCKKASVNV